MDERFRSIAATAAGQCSIISVRQLAAAGVDPSLRLKWERRGLLERVGTRTFALAGSEPTWMRSLYVAYHDAEGHGFIAGRSACRLMRLDGFEEGVPDVLVPRELRKKAITGSVRSTAAPIPASDLQWINGLRVLRAGRVIIDAPLFGFVQGEVENAIDSAIRLRLVSEQRLRTRVVAEHRTGITGSRLLLDALVDTGGATHLAHPSGQARDHVHLQRCARPAVVGCDADPPSTPARGLTVGEVFWPLWPDCAPTDDGTGR